MTLGTAGMPRVGRGARAGSWRAVALLLVSVSLAGCASPAARVAPVSGLGEPAPDRAAPVPLPDVSPWQPVADEALALAGTRYRYGGASPETGFDCSGLVWYVFGLHGVSLPRVAAHMAARLPAVERGERRVGDLLFFNTRGPRWSHVGIYVGGERFVHAPSARTGRVLVSSLKRPYWRQRLTAVRRPPAATES